MRVLILVVFLAACTSSAPTQYAQGVPMAPRPPAFNPVTDSPITIGQPGYGPAARVVPQPNPKPTRLLPPSREPGIWAADDSGGKPKGGKGPVLWEVELPMPPINQVEDPAEQAMPAAMCTGAVKKNVESHGLKGSVTSLLPPQRVCLLTRLYAFCLHRMSDGLRRQKEAGADTETMSRHVTRTARFADDFLAKWCATATAPEIDDIANVIEGNWGQAKAGGFKQ